MAGLGFTIRNNITEELAKKLGAAATSAEHDLAVLIADKTEPYVPKRTGSLVNRTQVYGNQIVYLGPYARVLYYGKVMRGPKYGRKYPTDKDLNISTSEHGKAQSFWFESAKAQNGAAWIRNVRRIAGGG